MSYCDVFEQFFLSSTVLMLLEQSSGSDFFRSCHEGIHLAGSHYQRHTPSLKAVMLRRAAASRVPTGPVVLVPLYIYPDPDQWSPLYTA